jgi:hypothetical protein
LPSPPGRGRMPQFTPDASLEESRRLVDGLTQLVKDRKKDSWID